MSHDHVTYDCNISVMILSCFVTCVTITHNITPYSSSKSKIKKSENKRKIRENRIKPSPLFLALTNWKISIVSRVTER